MKAAKNLQSSVFTVLTLISTTLVAAESPAPHPTDSPTAVPHLEPVKLKKKDYSPQIQTAPSSKRSKKKSSATDKTSEKSPEPSSGIKLPPLLQAVEKKYADLGTLSANFNQTNESAALKKTTKTQGVIEVKRPGMVRWEQTAPEKTLLVSNGKTFWFYTPPFDKDEPGQVIIRKAAQVQSKLATTLLVGDFSHAPLKSVKQNTPSRFTLIPSGGSAGTISRMEVQINPDNLLIMGVFIFHKDGNRSEVHLDDVSLGKKVEDSRFEFEIPKNTQIVKE